MKPKQLRASFKHLSSLDNLDNKIYLVGTSFTKKSKLLLVVLFSFYRTVYTNPLLLLCQILTFGIGNSTMSHCQWTNLFSDIFVFTTYFLFLFSGSLQLIMSLLCNDTFFVLFWQSQCTVRPWNIQFKQLDGKTSTYVKHKETYTKLSLHCGTCPFNDI